LSWKNNTAESLATKLSLVGLVVFAMVAAMSKTMITSISGFMSLRILRLMVMNMLGLIIIFGRTDYFADVSHFSQKTHIGGCDPT
jgi:hypothetical protein